MTGKTEETDKTDHPEEWFILRAKDLAVPATLLFYHDECARRGSPEDHLKSIRSFYERVVQWQMDHPDQCKNPDWVLECLDSGWVGRQAGSYCP